MTNNLETIHKIKTFFESIGFDTFNIVEKFKELSSKEAVLKRYSSFLNKKENEIKKEESLEKKECFGIYCKDNETLLELKSIFKDNGKYSNSGGHIVAFLNKDQSERLLDSFKDFKYKLKWYSIFLYQEGFNWTIENIEKGILCGIWTWEDISKNIAINWNLDILERYKDFLDWKEISKNPSIPWTFEFVEKFKDCLDWRAVKANELLVWNDILVDKYATYIFSSGVMSPKEISWSYSKSHKLFIDNYEQAFYFENNRNLYLSEYLIDKYADKWNFDYLSRKGSILSMEEDRSKNILFTDYLIEKYADKWNFKELSKSLNLRITTRIIEKYIDKWDWQYLVCNTAVKIEFSTIEKVKDILDWGYVRILPYLHWTEELIDRYIDYIFYDISYSSGGRLGNDYNFTNFCKNINHTSYFESNENVEWTPILIDKYKDKWVWKYIFKNNKIKFSEEQLSKYNNIFSIRQGGLNYIPWESFFEFGNTDWREHIIDKYNKITYVSPDGKWISKYSDKLVSNPYIIWNETLFNKYVKNLSPQDLGKFCKNAIFPREIIINNQTLWNTKSYVCTYHYKEDDSYYSENLYESLWKFLSLNKNINWDEDLLESCFENMTSGDFDFSKIKLTIDIVDKYWENLKKGIERQWFKADFEIIDLTFESFVEHEIKWFGYLIVDHYLSYSVNKSILELLYRLKEELLIENDIFENIRII